MQDYIFNGQGHGEVGRTLQGLGADPGFLRPYINDDGERCVTINTHRLIRDNKTGKDVEWRQETPIRQLMDRGVFHPVFNATSLRLRDWAELDAAVQRAVRQRTRAWGDLASRNSIGGFNAMARSTFEYEAMSDPGTAVVDMDGITPGNTNDMPLFKLRSIPLPITHSDFFFSQRKILISGNSGSPVDVAMAEATTRRVVEKIEQTLIGVTTGMTYGTQTAGYGAHDLTSTVFGYTNYTNRLTKTNLTVPTGTNPNLTLADVLTMRSSMYAQKTYGPYMLYHSTDWDQWLDNDYYVTSTGAPYQTLRDRLRAIEGIEDVKRLDFLTSTYTLLMVQMTSDFVQAINGMPPTVVQWESKGGMQQNFKVMAIQVPLLRSDYNAVSGILHATTV